MSGKESLPSTFPDVPAPWKLKGSAWYLITHLIGKPNGWSQHIPDSNFDTMEVESRKVATEQGAFRGGMGTVMLIRYSESPVGPYDELMIVPGFFTSPEHVKAKDSLRITRIYVSSLESVANGRRNWNIPKHLARFDFKPASDNSLATEVRIYDPQSLTPDRPFFAARLSPPSIPFPAIPFDLRYMPMSMNLVQPPLAGSKKCNEDGLVATTTWKSILPSFAGRIKPVSVAGLLERDEREGSKGGMRIADGINFPDVSVWSTGIYWPEVAIGFPEPSEL